MFSADIAQVVERRIGNAEVTGPNPVISSFFIMKNSKTSKVNTKYAKTALSCLALIPAFLLLCKEGYLASSPRMIVTFCIVVAVSGVLPIFADQFIYDDQRCAFITLLCFELIFLISSIQVSTNISLLMFAPLAMSLLYKNIEVTDSICVVAFLFAIFADFHKVYMKDTGLNFFLDETGYSYLFLLRNGIIYAGFCALIIVEARAMDLMDRVDEEEKEEAKAVDETEMSEESSLFEGQVAFDTEILFSEIKRDMEALIGDRKKFFTLEFNEDLPCRLFGNADKIKEALSCICSDILMFHREGTVNLYVGFDQSVTPRKGQMLKLELFISSVSDIAAHGYNKKALGAYLTKQIVEKLAGSFEDDSTEEEIAYRLCIMVKDESSLSIGERRKRDEAALKSGSIDHLAKPRELREGTKILVADDNRETCKLLDAVLVGMGADCTVVSTGNEAIREITTGTYQMAFIDQMMPDKSGEEIVREIGTIGDDIHIPIILMSVNVNEEARALYEKAGFKDSIVKPLRAEEIRAKAVECLL